MPTVTVGTCMTRQRTLTVSSIGVLSIYVASPATSPANSATLIYVTKIASRRPLSINGNTGNAGDTGFAKSALGHNLQPFIGNDDVSIEWKILEWDEIDTGSAFHGSACVESCSSDHPVVCRAETSQQFSILINWPSTFFPITYSKPVYQFLRLHSNLLCQW